MARYIDIEGAGIGKVNREQFLVPEFADGWNTVLKILEKAPTADVVEVTRCKKCEYWTGEEHYGCCKKHSYAPKHADDFCSCGERRRDNDL